MLLGELEVKGYLLYIDQLDYGGMYSKRLFYVYFIVKSGINIYIYVNVQKIYKLN